MCIEVTKLRKVAILFLVMWSLICLYLIQFFDRFSINYSNLIAFNGFGIFHFYHGLEWENNKGTCGGIDHGWTFTQRISVGYNLSERFALKLGALNVSNAFNDMSWAATGAVEFKVGAKSMQKNSHQ